MMFSLEDRGRETDKPKDCRDSREEYVKTLEIRNKVSTEETGRKTERERREIQISKKSETFW